MERTDRDLGARVRAARSYADLSQAALGELLGVERRIIVSIEADDDRHPLGLREAQQIARACGVPLSFLLNGWAASEDVEDRLSRLETALMHSREERDLLAQAHESLNERVEKRFGQLSNQMLRLEQRLAPEGSHQGS